jgi:hypothetical protein
MTITRARLPGFVAGMWVITRLVPRLPIRAAFDQSTGPLRVTEGTTMLEVLKRPDSLMAIAPVSQSSTWGTRPSRADLSAFLAQYVSRTFREGMS